MGSEARYRFRLPDGVQRPEIILQALESGVGGARGLRLAPLPPHSTSLAGDIGRQGRGGNARGSEEEQEEPPGAVFCDC